MKFVSSLLTLAILLTNTTAFAAQYAPPARYITPEGMNAIHYTLEKLANIYTDGTGSTSVQKLRKKFQDANPEVAADLDNTILKNLKPNAILTFRVSGNKMTVSSSNFSSYVKFNNDTTKFVEMGSGKDVVTVSMSEWYDAITNKNAMLSSPMGALASVYNILIPSAHAGLFSGISKFFKKNWLPLLGAGLAVAGLSGGWIGGIQSNDMLWLAGAGLVGFFGTKFVTGMFSNSNSSSSSSSSAGGTTTSPTDPGTTTGNSAGG